jgi:rfaE bifunctional protein kinase chain/domain
MDSRSTSTSTADLREFTPLSEARIRHILEQIAGARVMVLGDYCLDIYWFVDSSRSERSLETGLMTNPVREQRYALGGAGNVVNNLVAAGCRSVSAFGVVGSDPWGREMIRLLEELGVDTEGMLVQKQHWATLAYNKPHVEKKETSRFDFGNFNVLAPDIARALLERCRTHIRDADVVVVNQQVRQGIHTDALREGLTTLMQQHRDRIFVVDSRHYSDSYSGAHMKINDHEAARLSGIPRSPDEMVLREETLSSARTLFKRLGKPVFVTRGSRGIVAADQDGLCEIPGIQVLGQTDTVGAGDSALAGISLALAAGCDTLEAAQLGNFVAGVTVQKLNQTGTASPAEILAIGREQAYVYRPELAEDPRRARYLTDTEFEATSDLPSGLRITHAIFDHDGTISTLRQGWHLVMEPMMIRAILGSQYQSADESLYHRVVETVRKFIDDSTGIQTLVQMQELVEMVREFGCVPENEILDEFGYKAIYNEALMRMVRGRVAKLRRGELSVEDFVIKNAVATLELLSRAGVRIYLASGTDREDVVEEATALGYAHLFEGGIYGSVGDVTKEAKRIVLDRILVDIGPKAVNHLVTFGDGPVEIRETHKRGGFTIGIAGDEIRRYGLDASKRARLIRAGADLIVPDFSQVDRLLRLLGIEHELTSTPRSAG